RLRSLSWNLGRIRQRRLRHWVLQFQRQTLRLGLHKSSATRNGASLRRHRLVLTLQSGMESVPGEGGTFHAHREFAHAREDLQLAEIRAPVVRRSLAGEQSVE